MLQEALHISMSDPQPPLDPNHPNPITPEAERVRPNPPSSSLVIIGMGLLLIGLGVYAGIRVIRDVLPGFATRAWKDTTGIITRTWIERTARSQSGPHWSVKVQYSYKVEGVSYTNDRIGYDKGGIGGGGDEEYYRKEMQKKYPRGSKCTVYYDPTNPGQSCLETGGSFLHLIVLGLVALCLPVAGVWLAVWGYRKETA